MSEASELQRLRDALAAAGDVAYEWDAATDRLTWLDGTRDVFGLVPPVQLASGRAFNALILPEDLAHRGAALSELRAGGERYDCEFRVRHADGTHHWYHDRGMAEPGTSGQTVRVRGVLRRLAQSRNGDARLDGAKSFDDLTGHYNRDRLREALDQALFYSHRYGVAGAYLVVGVDKMTMVNQAFGHEVADAVIVTVGDRIERCLRASDVIGRVSGDRFGAVLPNCPPGELNAASEKILEAVRNTVIQTPSGPIHVTVSIGAVSFPETVTTSADAMAKADIALQSAKYSGRDCFVTYSASSEQQSVHRRNMVIAEKVQAALRENRLVFAYQPVIDSHTHETVYHECLMRLREPDGSILPAATFMPVVEKLGMIRPVDRTGLRLAVEELSAYPAARVAINVSGLTTSDRSWLRTATALLRGRGDVAERLIVEITETVGLDDMESCARFVTTLRDLGCRVALDDFGAGYTSFRHLKQLAVNIVKIDGSFVRNIRSTPDNLVFVRTLIDLARTFDLETVAECVETHEDADMLTAEGVDYLQGFAFGKPTLERPWPAQDAHAKNKLATGSGLRRPKPDAASFGDAPLRPANAGKRSRRKP
jgi:diguanylate cyclase (GGDEF)-like protein